MQYEPRIYFIQIFLPPKKKKNNEIIKEPDSLRGIVIGTGPVKFLTSLLSTVCPVRGPKAVSEHCTNTYTH